MTCGEKGHASFFVRGEARPQGSTRGFYRGGRVIITSTTKGLEAWRRLVADQGQAHAPAEPWDRGVSVHATFWIPRPKSEPKRRRTYPDRKPDIDKLARGILDALKDVFYTDDARVLVLHVEKRWAEDPQDLPSRRRPPGVMIEAWPVEDGDAYATVHADRPPNGVGAGRTCPKCGRNVTFSNGGSTPFCDGCAEPTGRCRCG